MDCEPVLDYGQQHVRWTYTEHGYHQGVATAEGSDLELVLTSTCGSVSRVARPAPGPC